jgi:phosphate transport system ATP-binding protein
MKTDQEIVPAKARVKNLSFYYGEHMAVKDVSFTLEEKRVMALVGPSGCGKTTLLRCFNRMHDLYPGSRYEGEIVLYPDNINLISQEIDPIEVRMRIGMVFQKPNPFPKSIWENIAFGLGVHGIQSKSKIAEVVESSLKQAALWEEVKDRLQEPAVKLSGGQQQRLCIARALAVNPEIILFDEPTSALDPIATQKIEELIAELKKDVTILIVTHNMQQAMRISDTTAFMYMGELIEVGDTPRIFSSATRKLTQDYVQGRFG